MSPNSQTSPNEIEMRTFGGPSPSVNGNNEMRTFEGPSQDKNGKNEMRTFGGPSQGISGKNGMRTFGGPSPSKNGNNEMRTFGGPSQPKKKTNNTKKSRTPQHSHAKKKRTLQKDTLTWLVTNCDVLTTKLAEFAETVNIHKPDVIAASEVLPKNFKEPIQPEIFKLDGYDMICHPNVEKNTGRGSILYIKSNITHMPVELTSSGKDFEEHIVEEIKIDDNNSMIVLSLYRRGASDTENNNKLLELLKEVTSLKPSMISMGDINLKGIDWENMIASGTHVEDYNHKFLECMRDLYLTQHVTENTRQRGNDDPSLLDLIITNEENDILNLEQLAPLGKSDHSILKFETPFTPPKAKPIIKICYDKGDYKKMDEHFSKIDWVSELAKFPTDVNAQWKYFTGKYIEAEEKFIPRKKVFINGKLSHKLSTRYDRKTLRAMKKKNHLWSKVRKNLATEEENLQYKRLRNKVKSLTRKSKKAFEKKIAKNLKNNPKAFWSYTQSKTKSRSTIPDLLKPGTEKDPVYVKTDPEKAELLLEYFSSVFTTEPDTDSMPPFEEREYEKAIEDINITRDMVLDKLKKLKINKSPGPDRIHPRVLNGTASSLSLPLSIIFRTSLETKTIPDEWSHANISAIFKKGKKTSPQNYRPVSLTCIACKIMESIIRDAMIAHLTDNNLFSPYQFGFISGRSTILQLLHVLKLWTEIIDQGGTLDAIYCDFMKAFDKVPHKRLVYKVGKYGIKGKILSWIEAFLSGRTQCVNVNGNFSSSSPVTSGIPQGSVLGPLLFVIYINDLPEVINGGSIAFLFADDTKMFRAIKSVTDVETLQSDIKNIVKWSNIWLLKFHPDKCLHLGVGPCNVINDFHDSINGYPMKRKICEKEVPKKQENDLCSHFYHYDMDGHVLKRSKCEKDIGVHVDVNLNFKNHTSAAIKKANRIMGITRRTFDTLDNTTFPLIFKTMVRPHLEYGAPVWTPHDKGLKTDVENVQKRATKRLPGMKDLEYPDRLRKLKMPTLAYRRVRGDMIQVFKLLMPLKKGAYDRSLPSLLDLKSDLGIRETFKSGNNNKQLYKDNVKKDIGKHFFQFRVQNLWNSLPQHIIDATTVKEFEIRLDKHWENQPLMYDNFLADIIT